MEVFHVQEGDLSNDLLVSDLRNVPIDVISVNASEVDSEASGR